MPDFRNIVQQGLLDAKMTQTDLAKAAGVHQVTLSRWLTGGRMAIASTVLAKLLAAIEKATCSEFRMAKKRG